MKSIMTPAIVQPQVLPKNRVLQPEVIDMEHTNGCKSIHTVSQGKKGSDILLAASKLSGKTIPVEQAWKAGRKEWMIIIVLAIVSLMVALNATVLVPVLPAIASDLDGNTRDTFWTGTAYLLTQSVLQPFLVSLSDAFGRRLFYLVSLGFFTIGSLLCCLSQNFSELLAGRSIQGIGGGGILALGLVIRTDIVPLRQRPIYFGVIQMSWALGSVKGPVIGSLFAEHTTWRWIFYINFPFCGIGFLTVPWVIRLHVERDSFERRLLYVDLMGGFLFVSGTCSFLIGVTWGGSEYPWSSWRTLVPIILGFAGVIATIVWEQHGAPKPFLRLELFNSYSALAAYIGAMLQGLLMFCQLYYIPFYFQSIKDYRPTITGLALLPITGALLPTSVVTGRLMSRFGSYRWAIWLGWVTALVGTGLLILLDVDTQVYTWVLVFVVMGLGHGLILISLNFSVQAMADSQNAAYAAAMYTCIRSIGMCFGVAVGGTVFQNELGEHLEDLQLPTRVANDAERFVSDLKAFPKASRDYQQYIVAYARSFKSVFVVLTVLTGVGGLLSLLIKEHTMNKELDSEHTLRHRKGPGVPATTSARNRFEEMDGDAS